MWDEEGLVRHICPSSEAGGPEGEACTGASRRPSRPQRSDERRARLGQARGDRATDGGSTVAGPRLAGMREVGHRGDGEGALAGVWRLDSVTVVCGVTRTGEGQKVKKTPRALSDQSEIDCQISPDLSCPARAIALLRHRRHRPRANMPSSALPLLHALQRPSPAESSPAAIARR